jgi:DNA-binding LytR/AlgR family response regulator
MKIVIIEDEKLSADYLVNLLLKIDNTIQIVDVFESVKDSIMAFNNGIEADLLFVDIHLSDGISFDIFSKVTVNFPIIFTTAYDEYALKAFKLNSIDYLLKPLGIDEVRQAILKFERWNKQSEINFEAISNAYLSDSKQFKNRFMVKLGDSISSIQIDEIQNFISEDGVVLLVTKNNKRFIIDYNLDELESCLNVELFFRINRKTIISMTSIEKVNSYFNSRLKVKVLNLEEESSIVSRDRVPMFKKWLDGSINT